MSSEQLFFQQLFVGRRTRQVVVEHDNLSFSGYESIDGLGRLLLPTTQN